MQNDSHTSSAEATALFVSEQIQKKRTHFRQAGHWARQKTVSIIGS